MKKNIIATLVGIMSLACMTAFAASPAFDSPYEEAAHWKQVKVQEAWNEKYNNSTACENPTYYAAPAFDNPYEEAAYWEQKKEEAIWKENHTNNTAVNNPHFYVIADPFGSSEQED